MNANAPCSGPFDSFGSHVFSIRTMRDYLSERAYQSLLSTIQQQMPLDPSIADEVADAMKNWAIRHGATHYTHWFQPLTGNTAEKQDAFLSPTQDGAMITTFSAKELSQGEADGSSLPSGGLRATFEARGYTAWDPTSPAFIKTSSGVSVLCIPTIFCGYHGEALDKKTPLLRSHAALSKQLTRLGKIFGDPCDHTPCATLGAEQEYFLVRKEHYYARPDLIQTGRTLFGRRPPRHQQMEDHYYGKTPPDVLAFMHDVDCELWRLGVPAKTRHNEVSPGQFELAPVFETQNLAVDHNMIVMQVLRETADRHGFACLLHEKPFDGVNGSGKHNNWSITGTDGKNWLSPGSNPHDNLKFLTMLTAIIKGVDTFADLLRATIATAGNELRLGANEAPPTIICIFLGDQLTDILAQMTREGTATRTKDAGRISLGLAALPNLPRDATDRNRTSPLAFTGNKFEFRAVGSSQSCATPNVILNAITTWAVDEIATELEAKLAADKKRTLEQLLDDLLAQTLRNHQRILFDGDNYSHAWREEAARRGLGRLTSIPDAIAAFTAPDALKMLLKYEIFSERELHSRCEIYTEIYNKSVHIEAAVTRDLLRSHIGPAALRYAAELRAAALPAPPIARHTALVTDLAADLYTAAETLDAALDARDLPAQQRAMTTARKTVDHLEALMPHDRYPFPTYADMFFAL